MEPIAGRIDGQYLYTGTSIDILHGRFLERYGLGKCSFSSRSESSITVSCCHF